uniref:Uncharacterized protein n=1 Tax=Spironucleus salmonicida TaxID=348837 RepID=V6LLK7_9EUKA|eukprot:EST45560.1 Hypothetical protein SS50377_14489 [Spironucleus salmonicida]
MTDQDQNTKAEAKPTQLTFSSLDNNMNDLLPKIVFQFNGTQFQISEVGDAVCYLKVAIDTVEALSLLHLFMWQHRQGLLLRSDIQLIIIQDDLKDPSVSVSDYWLNLVSLSIQMGFSVLSYQVIGDEKIQKRAEVQVEIMKSDHEIVIVSKNSAIDSKLFPNCIVSKKESKQQDQNEKDNQVEDYKLTQPQFKIPSDFSIVEKQAILQIIGIALHKFKIYAHLLPMILGYSAYLIYQQMLYSNAIDPATIYQSAGKSILNTNQQIYNNGVMQTNFQNFFELPVHLLKIFEFDGNNKFIFQQMCDVSYLFKAQYFAVFSAFFPLDNAVLSQSSRSGKTVTLHTIFYFNLFSGLQIPILINIGHQSQNSELQLQPLYNRSSINLGDNLKNIFASSTNISIETIAISNLNQGLISYNYLSYLVSKINIYIKCFQQEAQTNQIRSAFDQYFSGQTDFNTFKNISLDNFFKINSKAYCEADNDLNQQLNLTHLNYKKGLNEEEHIQLKKLKESYKLFIQGQKYDKTQKVIVLVDECLNHQKDNYYQVEKIIVQLVDQYRNKFTDQARSCIEYVLKILVGTTGTQHVPQIQKWLDENTIVDYECDQSLLNIKKKLAQKITSILDSDKVEEYFFKQLCYYDLLIDTRASALVDLIVISSPNFIHVKTSIIIHKFFSEMMINLKEYPNRAVFKQQLYHFLIMLYNPRSMETIFWRNLSYAMNQTDQPLRFEGTQSIDNKLYDYFIGSSNSFDKLIVQLYSIFKIRFDLSSSLNYQEIQIITHGNFNFLSAGTDLALINFIRQNQFIYTSESSRGQVQYTQSNILGTSQMHPSCLTQSYYRDMRITTQTNKSMIEQVKDKVKNMSIKDFYLTMMPELAAELQFLCPLVCPQIIINEGANTYFFNSTKQFQFKVKEKEIILNQISSHMQIHNSLFIIRQGQQVGANQLINQESKTELLKLQSIAKFNKYLHLTSSSSLNRDVVFVLHFLASQQFLTNLRLLESDVVQTDSREKRGIDQMLCFFKQQQISEISAAIFLVMQLSCTESQDSTSADLNIVSDIHMLLLNTLMRELKQYEQFLEIYFNPVYVTGYDITTPLKTIYDNVQTLFQGATFMFLQQSFDIFFQLADKQNMKSYIQHAIANAANCYATLLEMQLLKPNQKIAIVTIVDKTQISNLFFNPAPAMPDYLISLFGTTEEQTKEVLYNDMLSVHQHSVKERQFQSLNFLLESGNHGNLSVFNKSNDTGVNICFQTTNVPRIRPPQIDLIKQGRKITKEGELQAQKLLKEEEKQVYVDLEKANVNVEKLKAQLLNEESKQNAKTETIAKLTDMVKQAQKKQTYAEQQIQKQDILLTKVGQIGGFSGSKEEYKSLTEKLSEIIKENEANQSALAKQRQQCKDATQQQNRKKQQDKLIEENNDLRVKGERTYLDVQDYTYKQLETILNNVFMDHTQKQAYVVLKEGQAIQDAFKDQKMVLKYLQSKKVPRLTRSNDKFVPDQTCKIDVHQFIEEYKYLFSHLGAIQEKVEEARTCIQLKTHDWVPNLLNSSRTEYKTIQPLILKELAKIVNSCTDKSKVTYKTFFSDQAIKALKEVEADIGITDIFTYFSRLHLFPVQVVDQTLIVCKLTTDHEQFDPPAFSQPEIEVEYTESSYEILCESAIKTYKSKLSERNIEFLKKKENEVFDAACALLQFDDGFFAFNVKYLSQRPDTRVYRTFFKDDCFEIIQKSTRLLLDTFLQLNAVIVAIEEGVVHVIILE